MPHELKELSTEELLNVAATAEKEVTFAEAAAELVMRYKNLVYSQALYVCRTERSLADDVFQNTFLRLFTWFRQRRGKTTLHSFPGLLKVFARRAAIDLIRKEVRMGRPLEPAKRPDLDTLLYARALLDSLEGNAREVVRLTFFEQLSAKEIAARLGMTPGNVRVLRFRAMEQIRERQSLDELADVMETL